MTDMHGSAATLVERFMAVPYQRPVVLAGMPCMLLLLHAATRSLCCCVALSVSFRGCLPGRSFPERDALFKAWPTGGY